MSFAIGLYQFELSHPNQAPHMGMCLFIPDLLERGYEVQANLVSADHVDAMVEHIGEQRLGLVGFDSIVPVDVVDRVKEAHPELPVVVGGVGALSVFLESRADYAVVGPGRRAMRALAGRLAGGAAVDHVPNLFYRDGARIDHTGDRQAWSLLGELEPYRPFLDWGYIGAERAPGANHHQLSVIQELGCVYQDDALATPAFATLDPTLTPNELLPHLELSERAAAAIQPFLDDNRGCSFCVFRFQTLTMLDVARTVDLVMRQIHHLHDRTRANQFSLQSENPFRILRPLLERLRATGPPLTALLIRTMPSILLHKADELRRCLELARQMGMTLILQQLGFESFDERHLELYNKGITLEANRAAARLLTALAGEYGETLDCFSGHGLILFDPWTTIESLARNVEFVDAEAPFLARAVGLGSRLVFYDPFNPIFRRARQDALVVRAPRDFGWDFEFADPRTTDFVGLVQALNRHAAKRVRERGARHVKQSRGVGPYEGWIFRRALAEYQRADGDAERLRQTFFTIAAELDRWIAAGAPPPLTR